MKIGWLADKADVIGGAELTAAEFRAAAPKGVEVVDCPPGGVVDADAYVVHNCTQYSPSVIDIISRKPVIKYCHDMWPNGSRQLRSWLLENAHLIFCSPLQRDRFPWDAAGRTIIPPACIPRKPDSGCAASVDIAKAVQAERKGAIWLGHGLNAGKGIPLAVKWAHNNQTELHFYGQGPFLPPEDDFVKRFDPVASNEVTALLTRYKTFVFLPTSIEPFGRSVAEAWSCGCEIVTNSLVGARWWIENAPTSLEMASADFWYYVVSKC